MKITHQLFFALLLSFSRLFAQELALSSPAAQDTAEQPVAGVPAEPANPKLLTNFIEAGGSLATLTNAFGSFSGGYARGVASEGRHILFAEINGQRPGLHCLQRLEGRVRIHVSIERQAANPVGHRKQRRQRQ